MSQVEKAIPLSAHYRKATVPGKRCGTCSYYEEGKCRMYDDTPVARGYVCDNWDAISKDDMSEQYMPFYRAQVPDLPYEPPSSLVDMVQTLEPLMKDSTEIKAAGLAVRARDSGRVLMLQRAVNPSDPASGTWEFPGGVLNDGEHPYNGAKREWQEEMGTRLPRGNHAGEWRTGSYVGYIHEVPSESSVRLNLDPEDRRVNNPDDPDGDNAEVAAWFHPHQLRRMSSLRNELRQSRPWNRVAKTAGALYVISHAKTRYNRPGQPHDIVHGWMNTPIDRAGMQQARKLGKFLANRGVTELYSSDLKRAAMTAEIISRIAKMGTLRRSAKFRPWNLGDFAGHSSAEVVPKLKPYMTSKSDQPVDGGESFDTFKERFLPAFEKLMKRAQKGETVALVTHSRNIELIQGWLGGKGYRSKIDLKAITQDKLDPATVFQIAPTRSGRWAMTQLDDETVEKDVAPGAPGDLPPTGDMGDFSSLPSSRTLAAVGPTLNDVHVDRPLRNISINYATGRRKLRVTKADKYRQLIYGVVLEPNVLDSQDDFMLPDHVENAAHNYMKKVARGRASVSKLQHRRASFFKDKPSVVPVESFIAPCDFSYDGKEMVRKGTWVMALHVEDPNVWQDVMDGKYTGLSIGGTGVRQDVQGVPGEYMESQPAHWFGKEAKPVDFASWRDHAWEGS